MFRSSCRIGAKCFAPIVGKEMKSNAQSWLELATFGLGDKWLAPRPTVSIQNKLLRLFQTRGPARHERKLSKLVWKCFISGVEFLLFSGVEIFSFYCGNFKN